MKLCCLLGAYLILLCIFDEWYFYDYETPSFICLNLFCLIIIHVFSQTGMSFPVSLFQDVCVFLQLFRCYVMSDSFVILWIAACLAPLSMEFPRQVNIREWVLIQDGGVQGHALISSCKSTQMAASCWATISRRILEPIKKRLPASKDEEEATERW